MPLCHSHPLFRYQTKMLFFLFIFTLYSAPWYTFYSVDLIYEIIFTLQQKWFKPTAFRRLELFCALWAFTWAHVHYWKLIYGTVFTLVLVFIEVMYWLYHWGIAHGGMGCAPPSCFQDGSTRSAVASYQEGTFGDMQVCSVEVKIAVSNYSVFHDEFGIDRLSPLQYVLISFPAIDYSWHSVAMSSRPVHIADDQMEPLRGEPTTAFTFHIASHPHMRTWSQKVHQHSESRQLGKIRVMGPYGSPCVDVRRYEHVVLIAGGLGAAPLMSMLEYYLDPRWGQQLPVGVSRTKVITLVWAAKDRRLFDLFCGQQPTGTIRMALDVDNEKPTSNLNFVFRAYLHETGGNLLGNLTNAEVEMQPPQTEVPGQCDVDHMQSIADAKANTLGCQRVQILYQGRPNLFQGGGSASKHPDVFETLSVQNELGNPDIPGLNGQIRAAAVVVCGPKSMQIAVRKSVDKLNLLRRRLRFHIHNETWE